MTRILSILLAISLLANLLLGWAYLHQRDKATVATTVEQQAQGAANACSDGTAALATQAQQRQAAAVPKIAAAAKQADALERRADAVMAAGPAVPGDDCRSAQARVDTWWQGREKP